MHWPSDREVLLGITVTLALFAFTGIAIGVYLLWRRPLPLTYNDHCDPADGTLLPYLEQRTASHFHTFARDWVSDTRLVRLDGRTAAHMTPEMVHRVVGHFCYFRHWVLTQLLQHDEIMAVWRVTEALWLLTERSQCLWLGFPPIGKAIHCDDSVFQCVRKREYHKLGDFPGCGRGRDEECPDTRTGSLLAWLVRSK